MTVNRCQCIYRVWQREERQQLGGVYRRSSSAVRTLRRLSIEEARATSSELDRKWTGAFTRINRLCRKVSRNKEESMHFLLLPMIVSAFIKGTAQTTSVDLTASDGI